MNEELDEIGKVRIPAEQTQQPSKAAVDFLMQDYQQLNEWHNLHIEAGESRLFSFITMTGIVFTTLIAVQGFVLPTFGPILLTGGSFFLLLAGLFTFQKMLQRRFITITTRRRLGRIRRWFLSYYPELAHGMPYTDNERLRIDWGKNTIGTTAQNIALVNCVLVFLPSTWWIIQVFTIRAFLWAVLLGIILSIFVWYAHVLWSRIYFKNAEKVAQKEIEYLDALKAKYSKVNKSKAGLIE